MDQDGADLTAGHGRRLIPSGARLPRPVRAVVFDLDGTLLDTERLYEAAFRAAMAQFGVGLPGAAYDALVGLPTPARRALLPPLLGTAVSPDAFVAAYYQHRASALADGIRLKPGVRPLLALLDRRAIPVAIATSASAATAARHLTLAGLRQTFPTIVTRDDVAHGKPAPDSFLHAARLLDMEPAACLAVEDSPHGAAAALAAGMMVALVPDLVRPPPQMVRRCHAVLGSLAELADLLEMEPPADNDRSRSRV